MVKWVNNVLKRYARKLEVGRKDDKILLTIVKINKFNLKYWPRKSSFVIQYEPKFLAEF